MKKIGIIAGTGELPLEVIKQCKSKKIQPFVVFIKGYEENKTYVKDENITISFGQVGKVFSFFKKNGVKMIVFAGAVRQPNLKNILPDFKGIYLLIRLLKLKLTGDDLLLRNVIKFAEENGFKIIPAHKFLGQKIPVGAIGTYGIPHKDYLIDIELGVKFLKEIGKFDAGQSVAVQNGKIIGVECVEGTKKLIERCGELRERKGRKPILVKIKKNTQTDKADLPAIGENTIKQLKDANFIGVAMDSKNGIIIKQTKTTELANKEKILIYGI
ncbi:MAG: UDP-2,3-diacylglucosamine diphosphatase LpxI [Rickettsiales bacterium]|nr:UDP-2,3-diacylglucosamine diphosphatase LpxI [Rickettsiales bacterium]